MAESASSVAYRPLGGVRLFLSILVIMSFAWCKAELPCRPADPTCNEAASIVLLQSGGLLPGAPAASCAIRTVDDTGTIAPTTDVEVSGPNVYIAYADSNVNTLKVARSGDRMDTASIATASTHANALDFVSLALDGSNLYAAYHITGALDVYSALSTDGGVSVSTTDTTYQGSQTSIGFNTTNQFISYMNGSLELHLASSGDGGSTWSNLLVDNSASVGRFSSLVVEGSELHIAYYDETNDNLRYARSLDGGATFPQIVDADGGPDNSGNNTSLAKEGSNLYISYYDITNGDLRLAHSPDNGNTWNNSLVDSANDVGRETAISVENGEIYVAYEDNTNSDLRFAHSPDGGSSWNKKTVDASGNVGTGNSIAVDGSNVYISYQDGSNGALKVATSPDRGACW